MELADQQVAENEISPIGAPADGGSGAETSGTTPDKSAPEKPLSVRDQILKSVETVRTEEAKRARAADGKFAKLDDAASGAQKDAAARAASTETPKPETNAPPEGSKPVGPPSGWSKEAKAIWDQLPQAVRDDAVRRETEVAKGFDEYRTKTAQLSEISQVLEPLKSVLQQNGIQSDAQAVRRLVEWEGALRNPQSRMQAFQTLARQYGVDLSTLVPSSPSGLPSAAQEIPDPVRPVLDQFGNQLNSVEARLQSWEQSQVAEKLSSFAKDKPHFEAVRSTMGQLMQAGIVPAGDLDSAYQKAIAIHPEISAQIRADEDKKRSDELAKANADKARRASLAAVSPSARPPNGPPAGKEGEATSVRGAILKAVQQHREEQRA